MKNKLVTALLCVAAATALWLYVITVVSPNSSATYSGIQPAIQGEGTLNANGYMLVTDEFPEVKMTLKGNRVDLNKVRSSDITIGIDVSDINKAGTHQIPLSQPTFQSSVSNNAFAILDKSIETVTVEVDRRMTDKKPVQVVFAGAVDPTNYIADDKNPVLSTETVTISGPEKVVKQIAMARIDINLDGKTESIEDEFPITLCDKEGKPVDAKWITVSQDDVKVQVKISMVKKLPIQLEVKEGGGATESNISLKQSIQEIEVSGSNAILQDMTSLVVGTIDLSQVTKDQTFTFPIQLPEGITNESGETEVTVELKFKDLETKAVTVTDISKVIAPEGMTVELVTKRLDIQLRGPKKKMKNISAENLSITVDFSKEQLGKATVNAQITVNVDGVGALGVNPVVATIKSVS